MQIAYGAQARAKVLSGADRLADAVRVTLGSKGRNGAVHQKKNTQGASFADRAEPGADSLALRRGMEKAGKAAGEALEEMSISVTDEKALARAAAVSCGDPELGALIGRACAAVGPEGVVQVEDGQKHHLGIAAGHCPGAGVPGPGNGNESGQNIGRAG